MSAFKPQGGKIAKLARFLWQGFALAGMV